MSAPDAQAPKPPLTAAEQREARLAAALRENLRRRKTQARARAESPEAPSTPDQTKAQP